MFFLLLLAAGLLVAGGAGDAPSVGGVLVKPDRVPKADTWSCPSNKAAPSAFYPYAYREGMLTLCVWPNGKIDFEGEDDAWFSVVVNEGTGQPVSPVFGPETSPTKAAKLADDWRSS